MISLFPGSLFTRILNSPVEILSSKKMCLFSSSWPTCCYFSFPISYFVCGVQYFLCAVFVSAARAAYFLHKIKLEAREKSNANRNATNFNTKHWRFWHLAYPRDPRETFALVTRPQRDREFSIPGFPGRDFAKSRDPGIFRDGISLKLQSRDFRKL